MLRLVGAACAEQDRTDRAEGISVRVRAGALGARCTRAPESEESRRRGLMVVEAAVELADGRRRAA